MSEVKFTPGPWKRTFTTIPNTTEGYDTSPDIVNITIGDRNIPLAVSAMNSTREMRECFSTMAANATLMAAAPEMYAMLEELQQYFEEQGDVNAVAKIREVLFKARGEE